MTQEIIFKLGVDTGNTDQQIAGVNKTIATSSDSAQKEFDELRKSIKSAADEVDRLSKTYGENSKEADEMRKTAAALDAQYAELLKTNTDLGASFDDVYGEIKPLTAQMGELEDRMHRLRLEGQENSKEYADLRAEVVRYQQAIEGVTREIDNLKQRGSNMQAALQLGEAVMGGYAAFQGVTAMLGVENEELLETITKLQAAQSTLAGIESIRTALEKDSFLMLKLRVLWTNLQTAASNKLTIAQIAQNGATVVFTAVTSAATVAMGVLNAIMNLNPVFLLITAFAALAGAMLFFSSSSEHAAEDQEKLNAAIEKENELLELSNEKLKRDADNRIKLHQAQGASEKTLYEDRINQIKTEESIRQRQIKQIEAEQKRKGQLLSTAIEEQNEDVMNSTLDEIKANKAKYDKLKALDGEYYKQLRIEREAFRKEQRELEAKDAEATLNAQILKARGNFSQQQSLRKDLAKQQRDNALADVNLTEGQKFLIEQQYQQAVFDLNKEAAERSKKAREERVAKEKESAEKRLELERIISDLAVANIEDEWQRRFTVLAVAQQRERDELIAKYGKDTELLKELELKQKNELLALDDEQRKQAETKEAEAAKKAQDLKNESRKAQLEGELIQYRNDFESRMEVQQQLALLERDIALENEEITEGEKFKIQEEYKLKTEELNAERLANEEAINQAVVESRRKMADNVTATLGYLTELSRKNSGLQKAFALTQLGIQTALGFLDGLRLAQKAALETPTPVGKALVFASFFTQQALAVKKAADSAASILGASSSVPTPSAPSGAATTAGNPGISGNTETGTGSFGGPEVTEVVITDSAIKNGLSKKAKVKALNTLGG